MSRGQRGALFLLVAAFLVAGPVYRQVLGGGNRLLRSWTMFHGVGVGYVDAQFFLRAADGSDEALDAFVTLGYSDVGDAPPGLRGLLKAEGLRETVASLCRVLPAESDLRVRARVGTLSGWKPVASGESNLCAP